MLIRQSAVGILLYLSMIAADTASAQCTVMAGNRCLDDSSPRNSKVASERSVRYQPLSRTAIAITGPITITSNSIIMAGKTLKIELQGTIERFENGYMQAARAKVYRLMPPTDPVLLNGTRLCGQHVSVRSAPTVNATWIAIIQTSPNEIGLAVFSGNDMPISENKRDDLCGTFNYSR